MLSCAAALPASPSRCTCSTCEQLSAASLVAPGEGEAGVQGKDCDGIEPVGLRAFHRPRGGRLKGGAARADGKGRPTSSPAREVPSASSGAAPLRAWQGGASSDRAAGLRQWSTSAWGSAKRTCGHLDVNRPRLTSAPWLLGALLLGPLCNMHPGLPGSWGARFLFRPIIRYCIRPRRSLRKCGSSLIGHLAVSGLLNSRAQGFLLQEPCIWFLARNHCTSTFKQPRPLVPW